MHNWLLMDVRDLLKIHWFPVWKAGKMLATNERMWRLLGFNRKTRIFQKFCHITDLKLFRWLVAIDMFTKAPTIVFWIGEGGRLSVLSFGWGLNVWVGRRRSLFDDDWRKEENQQTTANQMKCFASKQPVWTFFAVADNKHRQQFGYETVAFKKQSVGGSCVSGWVKVRRKTPGKTGHVTRRSRQSSTCE